MAGVVGVACEGGPYLGKGVHKNSQKHLGGVQWAKTVFLWTFGHNSSKKGIQMCLWAFWKRVMKMDMKK